MNVDSLTAADRRRQRRLRSWLGHERMTVAMALAETLHHTSRGQTNARAGSGARDELHGDDPGPRHSPAGALQPRRRRARRDAAGQASYLVRAAGAGSAAHRAAECRCCPFVADSRRSCATDGGTADGYHVLLRHAHA